MLRAVLDTNAVLSGLLGRHTAPLLQAVWDERFTPILSRALLEELIDVLSRPTWQPVLVARRTKRLLRWLRHAAVLVKSTPKVTVCRDPEDNMLLACAWAGRADYLVTGDLDLRSLRVFRGTRIVTPAEFLRRLG